MRRKPVVALDIDGTLGEYHEHFIRFAEAWKGEAISHGYDGSVPFHQWCGMSKARYRQCKLAYRQGGLKRSMPVYYGARELSVALRKAGAEVVIATTRPYLHLSNIEPDTVHWLRRNGIQHDNLLIGEHKYRQLVREYRREDIVMCLEDQSDQLLVGESLVLPMVACLGEHNKSVREEGWPWTATNLDVARAVGLRRIQAWKAEQRAERTRRNDGDGRWTSRT